MLRSLVGSEMCIRDRYQRRVRGIAHNLMGLCFRLLLLAAAAVALLTAAAPTNHTDAVLTYHLPDDPNPDRSQHCNDVTADTSDSAAASWWSANSWKYTTSWAGGLCPAVYNITNNQYSPAGVSKVNLRRMGKG
eukprot:TRINITY_DN734_c0_g1_i1.p2 TRINITY_DN734_c0_g1~~TRINITY_DN734_c0_g1_i1.p2  ORF type:complete len:134 (+),score=34.96 TRINITY_DN734_c0_g1_i1:139-540(+)